MSCLFRLALISLAVEVRRSIPIVTAIIHHLTGVRSAEAQVAEAAFVALKANLQPVLRSCVSAVELLERRFAADLDLAFDYNASAGVPLLADGAYVGAYLGAYLGA